MDIKKVCLDVWYDKRKIVKRKVYNSDLKLVQWNLNHIHTEPYDSPSVRTSIQSRLENNMLQRAKTHCMSYNLCCDMKKFMEYVSNKFRVGMCWRNYGVKWELDHIIPVSFVKCEEFKAFSEEKQVEVKQKMCHYTNIQPLFNAENAKKRATITEEARKMLNG